MAGRVQVGPLDAPERLQPSGIQGDTFAAPAQPPVNKDLERLADALGGFASTVGSVYQHQKAEAKRRQAEQDKLFLENAEREYNLWRVQRTETDALEAIKQGLAPYQADRRFAAVVEKDWGQMEARRFAADLQERLKGEDHKLTLDPNFDPEVYARDRAVGFMKDGRFNHSRWATREFANGVEAVAKSTKTWHQGNVAKQNLLAAETAVTNDFERRLQSAVEQGLTPEQYTEFYRKSYKEFGPRISGGGAFDFGYGQLDEIQLKVLERAAASGDRKQAELALAAVAVPRVDPDTGQTIPPLKGNPRLKDKAEHIQAVASKTLATLEKQDFEAQARNEAAKAALRMDGSLHTLQDLKARHGSDVETNIPAAKIREQAVNDGIAAIRAKNGGADLRQEIEFAAKNDAAHPDVVPQLVGEATAALTLISTKGKEEEAVERFVKAGELYIQTSDINMKYAKDQVKGKNADVYETYTALVRYAKMPPKDAAQHVLNIYSKMDADQVKKADVGHRDELETAARGMDFYTGFGGEEGSPFGDSVKNGGEIRNRIVDLATILMRAQGINAKDALKAAASRIEQEAVWVNGRAIFGANGLSKGDEPAIEAVMKKYIATFPEAFKRAGVTDASQLTIIANPNGEAQLINKETMQFVRNYDPETKTEGGVVKLFPKHVLEAQSGLKTMREDYQRKVEIKAREKAILKQEQWESPSKPHVVLRNLIDGASKGLQRMEERWGGDYRRERDALIEQRKKQ